MMVPSTGRCHCCCCCYLFSLCPLRLFLWSKIGGSDLFQIEKGDFSATRSGTGKTKQGKQIIIGVIGAQLRPTVDLVVVVLAVCRLFVCSFGAAEAN